MPYGWVFFLKILTECKNIGTMGTVCGAEGITVVDVSYLVKGSMEFFELIRIGLDLVPSAQAALTSELTDSFISCTGLPSVSSTTVAAGAIDNSSFFLPLGRPRCEQSRQAWYHLKDMLDGWQGSGDVCGVRGDVRILLVLWCVEIHMDETWLSLMAT